MPGELSAFVLMPFDEEFDGIYVDLFLPVIQGPDYAVARADTPLDRQNIMRDVVEGIDAANVVIADLTGLNPNVMYELGLAHGLGRTLRLSRQATWYRALKDGCLS